MFAAIGAATGALWSAFVPPTSFLAPDYLAMSLASVILVWFWLGRDPIPGKRRGVSRGQGNWLVMILAVVLIIVIGNLSHTIQNLVSGFAWTFFGAAVKLVVISKLYEKLLYCPKCEATRWAVSYEHKWYCPRCGTKLSGGSSDDDTSRAMHRDSRRGGKSDRQADERTQTPRT